MQTRTRTIDREGLELAVSRLLKAAGEDAAREGLAETPQRYARFLAEWLDQPAPKMTTFEAEGDAGMIVEAGIPFYSLCEHHMLPFYGTAVVAYVPTARILGLSKLARAVQYCARGFQNQERVTAAVADLLMSVPDLHPAGVAVLVRAEHLCMSMRGVRTAGAITTTSALRGSFLNDARCRSEFLSLAEQQHGHGTR